MPEKAWADLTVDPEVKEGEDLNLFNHKRTHKIRTQDYLTYDCLPFRWRVLTSYASDLAFILGAVVIGECVSSEGAILFLHSQHRPSISCISYEAVKTKGRQRLNTSVQQFGNKGRLITQHKARNIKARKMINDCYRLINSKLTLDCCSQIPSRSF